MPIAILLPIILYFADPRLIADGHRVTLTRFHCPIWSVPQEGLEVRLLEDGGWPKLEFMTGRWTGSLTTAEFNVEDLNAMLEFLRQEKGGASSSRATT